MKLNTIDSYSVNLVIDRDGANVVLYSGDEQLTLNLDELVLLFAWLKKALP